jgi:4-carboxymuconolactone decarboxylase
MTDSPENEPRGAGLDEDDERRRRYERGLPWFSQVVGERGPEVLAAIKDMSPEMEHQIIAFGFGDIYSRPALPPRDRQLLTLAMLTALGGCEPQLKLHVNAALRVGVTPEEVTEIFLHAAAYCGFPKALNGMTVAKQVFDELGRQSEA